MARLRSSKEVYHSLDSHDRWLVSYADFVTLLFAFFVVMYAISSVNETKYEALAAALDEAFSKKQPDTEEVKPIDVGQPPTVIQPIILDHSPSTVEQETQEKNALSEDILRERRLLENVSEQFKQVLQPYIDQDLVEVVQNDFWIELEMNDQLLFFSGEAELSRKALPILNKVAEVVRRLPNVINVEGHTDNVPIQTIEFPSNWDLSSARATSVVREFVKNGISPKRLSAVGYGEFHPVADNHSAVGRKKNRRVVLVLMSQAFSRYGMSDAERAKQLNYKSFAGHQAKNND